jgi:phosphotransferase system HPr (HPr) family protein
MEGREAVKELDFDLQTINLHMRPIQQIASLCLQFNSTIEIKVGGDTKNCKSIIDLLDLVFDKPTQVKFCIHGADADQAYDALVELLDNLEKTPK